MTNPLLSIHNLQIAFNTPYGCLQAIKGIDLNINRGEIVGIVGESGCGKSVTAHSILQLLAPNSQIISGEILFEGEDLLNKKEKEMSQIRGSRIGMVFQDPHSALNPTLNIGYQLMEGLIRHKHLSKDEAVTQALHLLQQVGIADGKQRMLQYPHEFSGGMRQRIVIAMAIACQPLLLIADEPTTALDVTIQAQILYLLQDIRQKHHMSLLLITHDLGVIAHLCDRVYVMYAGQIVEQGTVEALFYHPQHPYTKALLKSKQGLKGNRNEPLFSITGHPPSLLAIEQGCAFYPRCPQAMKICQAEQPILSIQNDREQQAACWLVLSQEEAHV